MAIALSATGAMPAVPEQHQVLKQQRGDTTAVLAIGDRQGDLRGRPVAGELVAGHPHQLIAQRPSSATMSGRPSRHTRRASRSADTRLALKKRRYRFSGDIASCGRLTGS